MSFALLRETLKSVSTGTKHTEFYPYYRMVLAHVDNPRRNNLVEGHLYDNAVIWLRDHAYLDDSGKATKKGKEALAST